MKHKNKNKFKSQPCSKRFWASADEARERWERFYRWLGVGWYPKVMPIVCEADRQGTRKGLEWNKDVFGIAETPGNWSDYCTTLDKDGENQRRKTRLRQNWTLDGGQHVLFIDGTFKTINENWNYYTQYKEAIYYRSNNMKSDDDNWRRTAVWVNALATHR